MILHELTFTIEEMDCYKINDLSNELKKCKWIVSVNCVDNCIVVKVKNRHIRQVLQIVTNSVEKNKARLAIASVRIP